MVITYDEPKRLANLDKHRLDFADLVDGVFFETAVVVPAKAGRFKAFGDFQGRLISVVFSFHGTQVISIISMRPASRNERKVHHDE